MYNQILNSLIELGKLSSSKFDSIPHEEIILTKFNDNHGYVIERKTVLSESKIMRSFSEKKILDDIIPKTIVDFFRTVGDFKKNNVTEEEIRFNFSRVIFPSIFIEYLKTNDNLSFKEDKFKKVCLEYIAMWQNPVSHKYIFIPLINFTMESSQIELPHNYRIERFRSEEKNLVWQSIQWVNFVSIDSFENCQFKLSKITSSDENIDVSKEISCILTSMRLIQNQEIAAPFIFFGKEHLGRIQGNNSSSNPEFRIPEYALRCVSLPMYTLENTKVNKLIELIDLFLKLQKDYKLKEIETALKWFNNSYNFEEYETKIIHYAIVLESTLLYGIKEELKYRLAVRGSVLLRETHNPDEVYRILKEFYDARSIIVHDGLSLDKAIKAEKIDTFKLNVDQIIRDIIINLIIQLNQNTNLKNIIECLEEKIHPNNQSP